MRIKSSYIFLLGLLSLMLGGISIFLNHQGLALKPIIISFWIMMVGSLIYFIELKDEK